MRGVIQDVRYSLRWLRTARGFAVVAVGVLAVGTGGAAAVFSVVDAVLLRPLPYAQAERLVRVTADHVGRAATDIGLSVPELFDVEQSGLFEDLSGLFPININFTGSDEPERIEAQLVSATFFQVLGAEAQIGRVFDPTDYHPGVAEVAVISDGLWARRFGRDPGVVGRRVRLDNDDFTIVGVLPAGFRHPGGGIVAECDVWVPSGYRATPFREPIRGAPILAGALARLRPGATVEQAQAELDGLTSDVRRAYPDVYAAALGWRLRVVPLREDLVGHTRPMLLVLLSAVGLVLLLVCANLASLLLARSVSRAQEIGIRVTLGAGRGRVVRQLLVESAVLGVLGASGGLLVAVWALEALRALAPANLPGLERAVLDMRFLLFLGGVALASSGLFGMLPALQASRSITAGGGGLRTSTVTPQARLAQHMLVVAQYALALVLVVTSLLLFRSFARLINVDPGFDGRDLLTVRLWMPQPNDPASGPYFTLEQRSAFFRRLSERIASLPGVTAAAITNALPLAGRRAQQSLLIEGRPPETATATAAQTFSVSADYFRVMSIPISSGRPFADADRAGAPEVVLVNETFRRRYFGAEDPVGKRIRPGTPGSTAPWLAIIGIVGDVRADSLEHEPPAQIYRSLYQASGLQNVLVVRGTFDASSLGRAISDAVKNVDPDLPVYSIQTMDEVLAQSVGRRRFLMLLVSVFAGLAVILAALGIYGMMAFLVERRQREIGIRMAVGATRGQVIRQVLGSGIRLTLAGIAIGLVGAAGASGVVRSLLFDLTPADGVTWISAPLLVTAVSLAACLGPAWRASRTDPASTLRSEN